MDQAAQHRCEVDGTREGCRQRGVETARHYGCDDGGRRGSVCGATDVSGPIFRIEPCSWSLVLVVVCEPRGAARPAGT